jgi:pimeloyl-ACP methyl ester carboxylesterase
MTAAILLVLSLLAGGWLWTPDKPAAELEARYAAAPSQFVQAAGIRLHLRDTGPRDAPAVLLLHGFGASLHSWDAWAEGLQDRLRVVRLDLPGAALTGPDPGGRYSDERGLEVILALLDQLGIQQADVVGHSMGGRLAWRLAAEQPQRVRRLVLIAPDGFASPGFEYGKAPDIGASLHLMKHLLPRVLVRSALERAYADPRRLGDDAVQRYHELVLAPGVRGALLARLEQMNLQEPTPWLARISAPTLLLWGEQDALIPARHAQDYLRVIPGARLQTFPGVGHLPQEESPAETLPALREFLLDRR